ncbi:SDR family oxidoreductase [Micromonospora sp. NPDC049301]|uniref:SDR family oxidoreductase n=1 Tax=Micromonospora sp. NPDC049301 TaxID=3155723 RepID=UPI003422F4C3
MNQRIRRSAMVTGASSGIGLAVCRRLAGDGYDLVVNARDGDRLHQVAGELKAFSGQVIPVVGDASRPDVIAECLERCATELGGAPAVGLVNAGRGLPGTVISSDETQWAELFEINVLGALRQMRALANAMCTEVETEPAFRRTFDIVVIGSTVGRNVSPFNSVYGATKFAVHGAAEGLRRELGPKGIRVSLIEPGIVGTSFQANAGYDAQWFSSYEAEIGPVLSPDDISDLVRFIVSRPAHVHLNNVSVRPTRQDYP